MQKTVKFFLCGSILATFLFSGLVYAENGDTTTQATSVEQSLPQAGMLPTNPLYFFKDLGREIQVFFTFNPTRKAELRLDFSNQKLAETQKLIENNPNDTDVISRSLDSYKKETDNLTVDAKNLKQDSPTTQNLLNRLSEQIFNSQKILENLAARNIAQQKIQEVKNSSLDNITNSLFKIASPEKARDALENATNSQATGSVDATTKVDLIQRIQERAPEAAKRSIIEATKNVIDSYINKQNLNEEQKTRLQKVAEDLKSTVEYKQIVIEDYANQIISNNPELFSNLNNISDADKAILKNYAQNLLQGGLNNIDPQKVLNELNTLNISADSKKIIDNIQGDVVNKITNGQISCINILNPVCGKDGKTYNNVCELKKLGVEISYNGKCGECVAENKASSVTGKCCPGLVFCPANQVSATAANINGLCKKVCDKPTVPTTGTDNGACVQTWDPICGVNGKTYSNECFIKKAGVNIQYKGECKISGTTTTQPSGTIANPASTYCKEQGYTNEIRTNNDGSQYGMCVFAAGKECEEWAFQRGQCGEGYRRMLSVGKVEESMCIGKEYSISWEAKNITKIKLELSSVSTASAASITVYPLGEYDATKSSFAWTAGTSSGSTITPGQYQVRTTSIPSGTENKVSAISNVFTIAKCEPETTTTSPSY